MEKETIKIKLYSSERCTANIPRRTKFFLFESKTCLARKLKTSNRSDYKNEVKPQQETFGM
jgi:hypothetical protein